MTLQNFIQNNDFVGSIVLLEGKREVADGDAESLTALGHLLAKLSRHIVFRSGNASGADYYFSLGVAEIDPSRLQIIKPYKSHRQSMPVTDDAISLDTINIADEGEVIRQSRFNTKTAGLIDRFVSGKRDWITLKAGYIIRDTIKVIGTSVLAPATFAIFYDDLQNPETGGTGHTQNICRQNNVSYIDQRLWLRWLE